MAALRGADRVHERCLVERGEVPDRAHPEPGESLLGDRADTPHRTQGMRVEERELLPGPDHDDPRAGPDTGRIRDRLGGL